MVSPGGLVRIQLRTPGCGELTYKEFELLKYLAQHAGRVFTRARLLQEVGLRRLRRHPHR